MWRNLLAYFFGIYRNEKEKRLASFVKRITGRKPFHIEFYDLAFRHTSAAVRLPNRSFVLSNERLEYLGDAVLGAIIADYLYRKYPFKNEGFLTEMRSRMVSRDTLNDLGERLGFMDYIQYEGNRHTGSFRSMVGDAFEAFVGALYLDKGFSATRHIVIHKIIKPHVDVEHLAQTPRNFKSMLIEWGQRNGKNIRFEVIDVKTSGSRRQFLVHALDGEQILGKGQGLTKKEAEQDAAKEACESLNLV